MSAKSTFSNSTSKSYAIALYELSKETFELDREENGIRSLNKEGYPATCYIHPQDLDYNRPRLNGLTWHNFIGLKNSKKKFESLLKNFKFYSVRDVMEFNL